MSMSDFFDRIIGDSDEYEKKNQQEKEKLEEMFKGVRKEKKLSEEKNKERNRVKELISTELASLTKDMNLFGTEDEEVITKIRRWIVEIIKKSNTSLTRGTIKELMDEMVLEITSLGKIHYLIKDSGINEVMVNASNEIWIERNGKLEKTDKTFDSEEEVLNLARKIAGSVGRRIDTSSPTVDARLPDGSRVHIITPPLAMKGTTITIRKFKKETLTVDDLYDYGTITPQGGKFLEAAVKAGANILISGGTGSGKTTTLNITSNFVPNDERIVTIEDSAELQLSNEHVVKLESRPKNAEGEGEYTIRMLIKDALRMRPERIIVGEVRDGSAIDLLQAMNTGHDGSMGTVHSNSPQECIDRMSTLVLQAGYNLPDRAIKEQIAGAVDLVVQISRQKDGSRKITHISEVVEFDRKEEMVITRDLFIWKQTGYEDGKAIGEFIFTGEKPSPRLMSKLEKNGFDFDSVISGSSDS